MSIFQPLLVGVGVAHHYSAVPELSGIFMSHTQKDKESICQQGEQANGREEATFVPLQVALESVLRAMSLDSYQRCELTWCSCGKVGYQL